MTYWPRKCAAWCAACDESFHQVWSWYDYPLPSYRVIVADTLRDLVTLTVDLLTLVSGHTWQVTWSTPPPSFGYTFFRRMTLTMRLQPMRMRRITWPMRRGQIFPHIWNPWPPFAYSLYNFYGATIKTNGVIRQNNVWPCAKDHTALCAMRMRKITSALNVAFTTVVLGDHDIPLIASNLAIWQHLGQFLAIFSLRMRRNGYLWTSG